MAKVLIADDDAMIREIVTEIVQELGHETVETATAAETREKLKAESFDIVLLDLHFPDCDDLSLLQYIRQNHPSADAIMVTAETDDLNLVSQATRIGAFDYAPKPIRAEDIRIRVTRALDIRRLRHDHEYAISALAQGNELDDIVAASDSMKNIIRELREMATYDIPVLIRGDTGTGKELVSRALHYSSPRRQHPYVAINCAAIPSSLIESELFGHERGAFTGAHSNRRGAFEEASEGTICLDEIGDMDPAAQAALLRVLETGEFRSVGGNEKRTNARLVFSTNRDLDALVQEGKFRKDLFFRINRMQINIPPLEKRKADIPPLAAHFLKLMERRSGKGISGFSQNVLDAFVKYSWPGNARELRNEVERAYIRCSEKQISMIDLTPEIVVREEGVEDPELVDEKSVEDLNRLTQALKSAKGNISKASRILGVHRNTIYRWIERFELDVPGQK